MKFLDKFGLKPLSFELEGETVYYKQISYNLAVAITHEYNDIMRQLIIIRHCLCEEDGSMVFHEDTDLAEIGDKLPFEIISLIATEISNSSGPKVRDEQLKKKHKS
ncbi:hypothetical protein [Aeromonas rivipollensis]|uniref:Phage protein n=1 Tax=Aeromonas rivipollensis TaxID=948519 RepID=A0AAW9YB86_9GAMM|nr:hypothetical protein [Aeromonas rivipollensis]NEX74797.1 hypothetical protein [Aeromonas rivipollensis]